MIEKYLHLFNHLYGLDYRIVRISNHYGFHQDPHKPLGAIAVFIYNVLTHIPIKIWGDGNVIRDYIYISDVIDALIKVMNYEGEQKIFNIGSGTGASLNDIIKKIKIYICKDIDVEYKESRKFDISANVLDINQTIKEINWKPEIDLNAGLKMMIDNIKKYIDTEN